MVAAGLLNPVDVVAHLAGNLFRRAGGDLREHLHGQFVRLLQVFRLFAHAHPAERPKTVVKVERPHDVLDVGRVAEGAVSLEDVGPGAGTFQEEGVAVVKEVHAFGCELVDGGYVAAERGLHGLFEAFRLLGHQAFALFQAIAHRVVAAGPGVVQGGLVAAQVHVHVFCRQAFPQVHHVAHIGQGNHFLGFHGLADAGDERIQAGVKLVHPTLFIAFFGGLGVNLCRDAHHAGNVACLGLCAAHAAQTRRDKEQRPVILSASEGSHFPCGIHHRNGGAMHNTLRADIHVAAGRHLAVLAHAQRIEAFPIVRFGIVGNDHAVGHNHARGVLVAGKQAQRMAAVHHQRLLVGHGGEVLHHQPVLRPVLENGTVAAVDDELVRVLRHSLVQVVLDHGHDGRRLPALGRIFVNGSGI